MEETKRGEIVKNKTKRKSRFDDKTEISSRVFVFLAFSSSSGSPFFFVAFFFLYLVGSIQPWPAVCLISFSSFLLFLFIHLWPPLVCTCVRPICGSSFVPRIPATQPPPPSVRDGIDRFHAGWMLRLAGLSQLRFTHTRDHFAECLRRYNTTNRRKQP